MKKKTVLIVVLATILLGGLAWAYRVLGTDRQLAKVAELQTQLFSGNVPPEQRRKAFEDFRKEIDKLTPEQRNKLMRDNPPPFARQMQKSVVAFFDLPDDKRKAELDKRIDEMEKWRSQMKQRRPGRGGPGGRGSQGNRPGGFGGGGDPSKQNDMRKRMLDNSSPLERAMFGEYFSQLEQRRQERGLPPLPGPGRFPR